MLKCLKRKQVLMMVALMFFSCRMVFAAGVVVADIHEGRASLKIYKKEKQQILLKFSSGNYTRMTGRILAEDANANIRFSQITMPDGSMDGPFGREMTYDLPLHGDYTLRIGESLMAGDPWAGDFEVVLSFE